MGRVKEPVALGKLKPMLESKPGAIDRLADQKADVRSIQAVRNLIPTEQVAEDRILELAHANRPV